MVAEALNGNNLNELLKRYDLENPPPSYVDDYGSTYFLLPAPTNWQPQPKPNHAKPTPAINVHNYGNNYNNKPVEIITVAASPPSTVTLFMEVTPTVTVTATVTATPDEYGWYVHTVTVATATQTIWNTEKDWTTHYKMKHCRNEVVPGLATGLAISIVLMIFFALQLCFGRLNFWPRLCGTGTVKRAKKGLVGMLAGGQSALTGRGRKEMEYRRLVLEDEADSDGYKDGQEESSRAADLLRPSVDEGHRPLV